MESYITNKLRESYWYHHEFGNAKHDRFVVVVQLIRLVWHFATPYTAVHKALLPSTNCWSLLKLMSTESVMLSNHLILFPLLLLPSVFPSMSLFSNELTLHIWWPKYWSFNFSISPSNEFQGWFPLGLTGLSSLLSRDSEESSLPPQLKSINSLVLSLLHGPTLTSVYGYWKNHGSDNRDLCWQSDVSAFLIGCLGLSSFSFQGASIF